MVMDFAIWKSLRLHAEAKKEADSAEVHRSRLIAKRRPLWQKLAWN